jgi:tRNA (uracil-5-)-methyltransferase TRM9
MMFGLTALEFGEGGREADGRGKQQNKMANVQQTFDEIAPSWYNFRHRTIFKEELEELAQRWGKGRLLNVGCAHGPDFPPFAKDFQLYGIDISGKMIELAQKYADKFKFKAELRQADARQLPYADGFFDYAIAVASYHHIEGVEERLKALTELKRVLRPGGEAFITVWNKWQTKFWFKGKDTQVPWKAKDKTLNRYYHLFSYGELEKLARQAGFEIIRSFPEKRYKFPITFFSRNICLLVRKRGRTPIQD